MRLLLEHSIGKKDWLNKELLEAYASYYEKEQRWLKSDHAGKTIQELIDTACDELEESGLNLSETDVIQVYERIEDAVKVEFSVADGFLELNESLDAAKNVLKEFKTSGIDSSYFESNITKTIEKIESQIKKLLKDD